MAESEDEQVESSTTEDGSAESSTAEDAAEGAEGAEASAATVNTEGSEGKGRGAEKRIKQLLAERNEERERAAKLEARLLDLESKVEKPNGKSEAKDESEAPPAGLTPTQQVQWYVETYGKKFIERELGMDLGTVKTLLGSTKTTAEDYATRTWIGLCEKHGLDAKDETTQKIVLGLVRTSGVTPEDAAKTVAGLMSKKKEAAVDKVDKKKASVEADGVTGTMTGDVILARDDKHARELAHKGISVTPLPTSEIISRRWAKKDK